MSNHDEVKRPRRYSFQCTVDGQMLVTADANFGWNHSLDCSGESGWTDEVLANDDGEFIFTMIDGQHKAVVNFHFVDGLWQGEVNTPPDNLGFSVEYIDDGGFLPRFAVTVPPKATYTYKNPPLRKV